MASSGPKPGNLFWPVANNEDGLPAGMDMPEVSKHPEEDMTPMEIDDGALNAYVFFSPVCLRILIIQLLCQNTPRLPYSAALERSPAGGAPPMQPRNPRGVSIRSLHSNAHRQGSCS